MNFFKKKTFLKKNKRVQWQGTFTNRAEKSPIAFEHLFVDTDSKILGFGRDTVSTYKLQGEIKEDGTVEFTKKRDRGGVVKFQGKLIDNTIRGTWMVKGVIGQFEVTMLCSPSSGTSFYRGMKKNLDWNLSISDDGIYGIGMDEVGVYVINGDWNSRNGFNIIQSYLHQKHSMGYKGAVTQRKPSLAVNGSWVNNSTSHNGSFNIMTNVPITPVLKNELLNPVKKNKNPVPKPQVIQKQAAWGQAPNGNLMPVNGINGMNTQQQQAPGFGFKVVGGAQPGLANAQLGNQFPNHQSQINIQQQSQMQAQGYTPGFGQPNQSQFQPQMASQMPQQQPQVNNMASHFPPNQPPMNNTASQMYNQGPFNNNSASQMPQQNYQSQFQLQQQRPRIGSNHQNPQQSHFQPQNPQMASQFPQQIPNQLQEQQPIPQNMVNNQHPQQSYLPPQQPPTQPLNPPQQSSLQSNFQLPPNTTSDQSFFGQMMPNESQLPTNPQAPAPQIYQSTFSNVQPKKAEALNPSNPFADFADDDDDFFNDSDNHHTTNF